MTRTWHQTLRLAAALTLVAGSAEAQRRGLREVRGAGGTGGGLGFLVGVPVGEFSDFVGVHPGVSGAFTFGGAVGMRVGGSLLVYGHERVLIPTGSRLWIDVTTSNMIGSLGLGPQITLGRGPVRLYGYGTIGFSYFTTVSSLSDDCGCDPYGNTTNFDDFALAHEAGAGMQLALTRRGGVFLDLSARYLQNGRVQYLTEGGIVENPDGTVSLHAIESQADLVVFQIGLSFGHR